MAKTDAVVPVKEFVAPARALSDAAAVVSFG